MTAEDDFVAAYRAGEVVFFAGAGASFDSGAVMPPAVLAASADLFLPSGRRFQNDIRAVLQGAGVPGTPLRGIQPEIFYEHLLSLKDDREALGLWRVLEPAWLAAHKARLSPNANHLAIARYSAATGLPVFTTNFDMLFEAAGEALGLTVETLLPGEPPAAAGALWVFKLHGTISRGGVERLGSLQSTMQAISAVDHQMIDRIREATRGRALAFVGYSGCDIDYFPVLAGLPRAQAPFWFVPPGDALTEEHANQIGARVIRRLPSELFAKLHPGDPPHVKGPNNPGLLNELKRAMPMVLSELQ